MYRTLLLLLFSLFIIPNAYSQEEFNWKKHEKLANKLFEAHQYMDAAAHYKQAWQQHIKDEELIYKAGECYYLIKDFKKAIEAYKYVKDENERFPIVGLKYARSLKQDGQYEAANQEFIYFISAYQGSDKSTLSAIVAKEIKGCDRGIELAKTENKTNIIVKHLGENINSPAIEFAPIPYTDDLLYYSSTMKGNQATLFRSQRKGGEWNKAVIADGLPNFPNKHLANGSFAPDAKRFYFTLCDNSEGLSSKCEIYVLKREKSKWSAPIRLRDYINITNSGTTTQPWVVHRNGQEILYFSSDREGGFGGMDIWYSTRNISSDDIDFTYPVNAGFEINTIGDEITPSYDVKNGILYYSSNGKVSLGGWDIFKAKGALDQWEVAENLGIPINSSADDFYYVVKPSGKGGFLVSNRLYGAEKISTQHEDIFEFGEKKKETTLYALGQIMDSSTMLPIRNARVSLYELVGGKGKLLSSKKIVQSNYRFQVLPGKKMRLVAEKEGYLKNVYEFDTYTSDNSIDYTHIFSLFPRPQQVIRQGIPNERNGYATANYSASTAKVDESIITQKRKRNNNSSVKRDRNSVSKNATISVMPKETIREKETNSVDISGIYYKIQLIAVNRYNANHSRYKYVKNINQIEIEEIEERRLTRVLIANFATKLEAERVKKEAVRYGFSDAFIVKYKNGKRVGRLW